MPRKHSVRQKYPWSPSIREAINWTGIDADTRRAIDAHLNNTTDERFHDIDNRIIAIYVNNKLIALAIREYLGLDLDLHPVYSWGFCEYTTKHNFKKYSFAFFHKKFTHNEIRKTFYLENDDIIGVQVIREGYKQHK